MMTNRFRETTRLASLLVAAGALGTAPLAAQSGAASEQYSGFEDAAWQEMQDGLLEFMSEDAAGLMKYIVYHDLVVNLCEGIELDHAKFKNAVLELHPENWDELNETEHKTWNDRFLVSYGMTFGVMLAEHADNREPFCGEANRLIADEEELDWTFFLPPGK